MDSVQDMRDALEGASSVLHAAELGGSAQERLDGIKFQRMMRRKSEYQTLALLAGLERDGEFTKLGVRPAEAVADLERCRPAEARRKVSVAAAVFPSTLDGQPLDPKLPATAAALGSYEIDLAHAEVIERVLDSPPARRLDPSRWAGAEQQLADWARVYRPDELYRMASNLLEQLDQDGAEPDDDEPQVNELAMTRSRDGIGGRIKGRLDSVTFEALALAIRGLLQPPGEDRKSLEERQADALGELCERALDDGRLPTEGGERPHVSVTVNYEWLLGLAKGAGLEFGGTIGPGDLRRLLCDAKILPVVLGGDGQPLDVGRECRTFTRCQRRAIAVRDGGCAYPGCHRKARGCEVHHIVEWWCGGETSVDNGVMLCKVHHRMIHLSDWKIRMVNGIPEFIPPKWLDATQLARRKPAAVTLGPVSG